MPVSTQIIQVIDALCQRFGVVVDWSMENIYPMFQQLMERYAAYMEWKWIWFSIFFVAITAVCLIIAIISFKFWSEDFGFFMTCCTVILFFITISIIGYAIYIVSCTKGFPEKLFIDYLVSILNGGA